MTFSSRTFDRLKHHSLAVRLAALALAAGLMVLAPAPAVADGPAPDRSTAKFEIRFMQDMIDHHFMAVQMAQICQQKAVHEELRALCEQIETTQAQEIEMMQSWLQDWYGTSYDPQMTNGDRRQLEKLASLSGAEFEIEFMQMMIKHHRAAIREASKCVDRAFHNELENLCESIIVTKAAEIQQMRTWLCQWYGICKQNR